MVELIEIAGDLEPVRTADGHLVIAHEDTALLRPLQKGDEVVLRDLDGEFRAGEVLDVHEDDAEGLAYVLLRGVRLPPEQALERLAGAGGVDGHAGPFTVHSVLDLLGQLRDQEH